MSTGGEAGPADPPGPAHDVSPEDAGAIRTNLAAVTARIEAACEQAGRPRSEVRLLLATKTVGPGRVRVAIEAGADLVAENRVQEVRPKFEALADLDYERHFIGHLQSNKINALVPYVSCIQSLDRLSLARKLHKLLSDLDEIHKSPYFHILNEGRRIASSPCSKVNITEYRYLHQSQSDKQS